jgi:uncharacterized repeat protein (TIGR03803 family)
LAGLVLDSAGNLYGTTSNGGVYGYGTVFQLVRTSSGNWVGKTLHSFNNNGTDGYQPIAGLAIDAAGNLYGTTSSGGTYGWGTAFKLKPSTGDAWIETILHSFNLNGADGYKPSTSLVLDPAGTHLYGTTAQGGTNGAGVVFQIRP